MPITQTMVFSATPPTTGENPTTFNYNAIACWVDLKDNIVPDLNVAFGEMNTLETNVNAKEVSAVAAAANAVAAANFKGTWTNQLTSIGESWEYSGVIYGVLVAGTASPAITPSNWFALTIAQSIKNTPSGGVSATTVQGAIDELDTKKLSIANIHAATSKTTPVDADELVIADSALSFSLKKLTWANIKATLKTYFDTLYFPLKDYNYLANLNDLKAEGNYAINTSATNKPTSGYFSLIIYGNGTVLSQLATNRSDGKSYLRAWNGTIWTAWKEISHSITTLGTTVSTATGTSFDFTGISANAKRITINFNGVSTNGTSGYRVQAGVETVEVTGYVASATQLTTSVTTQASSTSGFNINSTVATTLVHGSLVMEYLGSNLWVARHTMSGSVNAYGFYGGGSKTFAGVIDTIRVTSGNGTDTFDAGSINILVEE